VALLRQQLFAYRDLWMRIDDPFQPPTDTSKLARAVDAATDLKDLDSRNNLSSKKRAMNNFKR
jgi:hypothetical protein